MTAWIGCDGWASSQIGKASNLFPGSLVEHGKAILYFSRKYSLSFQNHVQSFFQRTIQTVTCMRQQSVSRSCARAGSVTQHRDKDISILLMIRTAILGMIGCIQIPTANKEIHVKISHFHSTSTQLIVDAGNIIIDTPASFGELKKKLIMCNKQNVGIILMIKPQPCSQDRCLILGFTEESPSLPTISLFAWATQDLFPNFLLFFPSPPNFSL